MLNESLGWLFGPGAQYGIVGNYNFSKDNEANRFFLGLGVFYGDERENSFHFGWMFEPVNVLTGGHQVGDIISGDMRTRKEWKSRFSIGYSWKISG
mgnify:CR=1 FL=1